MHDEHTLGVHLVLGPVRGRGHLVQVQMVRVRKVQGQGQDLDLCISRLGLVVGNQAQRLYYKKLYQDFRSQ